MATRAVVLCVAALAVLVASQSSSSSTAAGSASSSGSETGAASSTVISGASSSVGVSSTASAVSSSTGEVGSSSASVGGSSSTGVPGSISNSTNGTVVFTASSSGAVSSTALGLVIDFNVTVSNYSGRNHYFIQGMTGPEPELYLTIGHTYTFQINAPSDPFWIKTAPVSGNGSAYVSSELSANGVNSSVFTFQVTAVTPRQLYYVSEFDAFMVGNITVVEASSSTYVPYLLSSTGIVSNSTGDASESDNKLTLGLALGLGIGGGLVLILIVACCCCKKRSGRRGTGLQEQEIMPTSHH